MERREHWEHVYQSKADKDLSWFQSEPAVSLALMGSLTPPPRRVIDIGGGQSGFAAELISRGVAEVAVLDISAAAIERARQRLGQRANRIRWIHADILDSPSLGTFDLWHDRAVFHFLTEPEDRRRYVEAVERSIPAAGHLIVATFALAGPEKCSGLPVCRYDAQGLAAEFGPAFCLVKSAAETHSTPWGKPQEFTYTLLQRTRVNGPNEATLRFAHSN